MQEARWPELKLLYAVPNGGRREKLTAWRLKQEGVKPGVPDLCLPVARGGSHGLYIEMKNDQPRGVVSSDQKWWIAALAEQGYAAVVCYDWEEAVAVIQAYLRTMEMAA